MRAPILAGPGDWWRLPDGNGGTAEDRCERRWDIGHGEKDRGLKPVAALMARIRRAVAAHENRGTRREAIHEPGPHPVTERDPLSVARLHGDGVHDDKRQTRVDLLVDGARGWVVD